MIFKQDQDSSGIQMFWNFSRNLWKVTPKQIVSQKSFSQKCFRNHFLVLTCNVFENESLTSIAQLFSLYFDKLILPCIVENIQDFQLLLRTPVYDRHSRYLNSEFRLIKSSTLFAFLFVQGVKDFFKHVGDHFKTQSNNRDEAFSENS